MYDPWRDEEEIEKPLHYWNIVPKPTKIPCCSPQAKIILEKECEFKTTITWTVGDIAKAARLLSIPPINTMFEDEEEMRRVYTLIYDTFRYKRVFNEVLNDICFYQIHPDLQQKCPLIWLLFFDMYHRSFKKREPAVVESAKRLFCECGIASIEDSVWSQRVKLAAAVSRLRIKNSALRLSELLPHHLRDERVSNEIQQLPVTCWINPNKVKNEDEILAAIQKNLSCKLLDKDEQLQPNSFKWDTLCPNFIIFHASLRAALAKSSLVHKHKLIVQDRSFCLGPAAFGRVMLDLQLAGSVVQSHVNSPRTTAYLATLLSQNTNITALLVFNAGTRKPEYESYLHELGTKNVFVYSEKMMEVPTESTCLDRVIAVFATPPNSYTAVYDPIDLVCSRGGDLAMLEILTETETTDDGQKRVISILQEQRSTLSFAMSRPQIQFVLYETHSELNVENDEMVRSMINNMNKLATIKQAELQGKVIQESKEINNNEELIEKIISKQNSLDPAQTSKSKENLYKDISVPDCDVFYKAKLPNLCSNEEHNVQFTSHGCFLALLQRKEVTKLDNKYMIKVAEERGLFGNTSSTSGPSKGSRSSKTRKEKRIGSPSTSKMKKRSKHIELDRIAAPTQASMRQSHQHDDKNNHLMSCPRCRSEMEPIPKVPQSRLWWSEATRHLTNLRESLVNKKVLQSRSKSAARPKLKVDEIVAKSAENCNIPLYPRLRLTRSPRKIEKLPLNALDLFESAVNSFTKVSKQWDLYKKGEERNEELPGTSPLSKILGKNPLALLKSLTYAGPKLKDLISSRVPYHSPRGNYPNYGWRFYFDRTGVNTNLTQLCPLHKYDVDEVEYCSISNNSHDSSPKKGKRTKKKHENPAEVLLRVSQPTHSSLTRSLHKVHEDDCSINIPECEKCKKRNME